MPNIKEEKEMKKILLKTLALLMCLTMLTGCGNTSGDNSSNGPGNTSGTPTEYESVKITDSYSFEDPTDLDFDTRYVLYMGPTSDLVAPSVEKGQLYQYTIIYAKQDMAAGEYSLYVCDTAEHAQSICDEAVGYGMNASLVAEDNTVVCMFNDEYALQPSIDIYQMAGMISDTKAATYAQMYVNAYGAEMKE